MTPFFGPYLRRWTCPRLRCYCTSFVSMRMALAQRRWTMMNPFLLPVPGSCPAVSETGQVIYRWWSHDIVCVYYEHVTWLVVMWWLCIASVEFHGMWENLIFDGNIKFKVGSPHIELVCVCVCVRVCLYYVCLTLCPSLIASGLCWNNTLVLLKVRVQLCLQKT